MRNSKKLWICYIESGHYLAVQFIPKKCIDYIKIYTEFTENAEKRKKLYAFFADKFSFKVEENHKQRVL